MDKQAAVASLGQTSLLRPVWLQAALVANDRLKVALTVLQAAAAHANHPGRAVPDLSQELAAADLRGAWWQELIVNASLQGADLVLPEGQQLAAALQDDLVIMARPLLGLPDEGVPTDEDSARQALRQRRADWLARLQDGCLTPQDGAEAVPLRLTPEQLRALTHGQRHGSADSLHLLVMDLHKALNHLATELASEVVDGAHVWQLQEGDHALVAAFMRGLNRTRALKLDHPGLDTAATHDGARLLIQNDIGTNDAHVLVVQVEGLRISLTYSDLHKPRFAFFQARLAEIGAQWSAPQAQISADLNAGRAYQLGTARFDCVDAAALAAALEGIGARIVFLIDWNSARKRLQNFVSKPCAMAVLTEAAQRELGHRAWLEAGGAQLIYDAMQALGPGAFRIGDRLDGVLGETSAQAFLVEVLALAWRASRQRQPVALVADEVRLLLTRSMQQHRSEFDLLGEHAAYSQALADAVHEALSDSSLFDASAEAGLAAERLATRAKDWERTADHLVMRARSYADRQPRWRPVVALMELADDVADALEEGAFLIHLLVEQRRGRGGSPWHPEVSQALQALAETVLAATQDHVRAVAVLANMGQGDASDQDEFVAASWRVLRAERRCDELLREARRVLCRHVPEPAVLLLAGDLAANLERASDSLLSLEYRLRDLAFHRAEATAMMS
jgi:uncharacterized protein Yka (UPF0111/DUF47 family)